MTTTKNNEHKKLNFSSEREQSQACLNSAEHEKNQGRKVLNVPNLRFPEFQGEWEKCTFDEIAQYKKGPFGSALKKDLFVPQSENAIKVYEQQNAIKKDWTLSRYYITKDYFNAHMKQFVAKAGDLIVSCAGTIGEVYELPKDAEEGVFNQALMRVRVNDEVVNKEIFITVFSSMIDKFSKIYCNGSAIKNIPPFADLKRTQVYLPCKEEQIVIAQLLRSLDERITTQNKIIEDLKKLKSAIIEKLYSEIQGKECSFGQLFDVVNERNKQMEYSNILSASQEKGMVNRDDLNLDIQFERSNINTYKIVRKGDYVIHLRSFQGGFAFSNKLGVCSPAYTILRPNNLLEYGYLSNYFTSQRFIKSLILVTYGIRDGRSINVDEWLGMKTTIPSKEHQQYIVKAIGSFDRKIESEEAYTPVRDKIAISCM